MGLQVRRVVEEALLRVLVCEGPELRKVPGEPHHQFAQQSQVFLADGQGLTAEALQSVCEDQPPQKRRVPLEACLGVLRLQGYDEIHHRLARGLPQGKVLPAYIIVTLVQQKEQC